MRTRSNRHRVQGRTPHRAAAWMIAVAATAIAAHPACAQEEAAEPRVEERPFAFVLQAGAGGSLSRGPEQNVPSDAEESRLGYSMTARALWRPGHLLGIGVQSGFTRVSTLETSSGGALHISTIPALLVFAMETGGFDASVASGWQRYIASGAGGTISSAWEMSYSVAAGYFFDAGSGLGLGAELSFTSLPERTTDIVALQVRGQYTITY
jgi:hypothetical protein